MTIMKRSAAMLAVITVVLGAAACTGGADPSPSAALSTSVTTETAWDPMSWEPTVKITPFVMTEDEKIAWRSDRLKSDATNDEIDPVPDAELVRWSANRNEWTQAMADCLTEAGFPTKPDFVDSSLNAETIPESQQTAFDLAFYTCDAKYMLDPVLAQEWTAEQLGLTYDYWEQYFIPCMAAHGVEISQSKKPTREAFVAAFHTPNRYDWWPNEKLAEQAPARRAAIAPQCPPYVPAAFFFGS